MQVYLTYSAEKVRHALHIQRCQWFLPSYNI